ncbi:LOW QUALITY PROTEIN: hypothetical protein V2J09_008245, partial [Rumex salicifolius]
FQFRSNLDVALHLFKSSVSCKICYPALEGQEWQIITGSDPKNTPWSYHNAGSWPTLLWQLTAACIKMNRPDIAAKGVQVAEKRLSTSGPSIMTPEKGSSLANNQGYLVAKLLLAKPNAAKMLITDEDPELVSAFSCMISTNPRRKRGPKIPKQILV